MEFIDRNDPGFDVAVSKGASRSDSTVPRDQLPPVAFACDLTNNDGMKERAAAQRLL